MNQLEQKVWNNSFIWGDMEEWSNSECYLPARIIKDILKARCLEDYHENCRVYLDLLLQKGYLSPVSNFPVDGEDIGFINGVAATQKLNIDSLIRIRNCEMDFDRFESLMQLKEIMYIDQKLHGYNKYRLCKSYGYNIVTELTSASKDTALHNKNMKCFGKWRKLDSFNLSKFHDLILEWGGVRDEAYYFGTIDIAVLLCHMGHYKWSSMFNKILYNETIKGNLYPGAYAWYIGYHNEYFRKPKIYYFTNSVSAFDTMPQNLVKEINLQRNEIGLLPIPSVLWNTKFR